MHLKPVRLILYDPQDCFCKDQKELLKRRIIRICGEAFVQGVLLTQADLSLVQAMEALFIEAHLARAILFKANLSRADLRQTDLAAAENVSGVNFEQAQLPPGYRPINNPRRSRFARGFFGKKK